jgi:hypothetical protein
LAESRKEEQEVDEQRFSTIAFRRRYSRPYCPSISYNPNRCIVGAQWGDEGKGKLVDVLCDDVDIVARCQVPRNHFPTDLYINSQGGNNAGHTIVVGDVKYNFHILPSGTYPPTSVGRPE